MLQKRKGLRNIKRLQSASSGERSRVGGRVSTYRLYCLDGAGKITLAEWLEADDDADALRKAGERSDYVSCEVWDRGRLVGRVPARPAR
jgi:hypothetical protein